MLFHSCVEEAAARPPRNRSCSDRRSRTRRGQGVRADGAQVRRGSGRDRHRDRENRISNIVMQIVLCWTAVVPEEIEVPRPAGAQSRARGACAGVSSGWRYDRVKPRRQRSRGTHACRRSRPALCAIGDRRARLDLDGPAAVMGLQVAIERHRSDASSRDYVPCRRMLPAKWRRSVGGGEAAEAVMPNSALSCLPCNIC